MTKSAIARANENGPTVWPAFSPSRNERWLDQAAPRSKLAARAIRAEELGAKGGSNGRQEGHRRRRLPEGGGGLFRKTGVPALRRRLVAVGARRRRGHLGPLFRLEPWTRHGRLGRNAGCRHPHHAHVYRSRLLHRRNGAGASAHGRG